MNETTQTLQTLWTWILAACGMIIALGGAWAIVAKVFKPNRDMRKDLDALIQKQIEDQANNDRRFKKDLESIEALNESTKYLCKGMLALLNHEISGNSIDKITKARDELSTYLIEK